MVALDEFSRVVSEIHASSICPDNWPVALADIRNILNAHGCALFVGRGASRSLVFGALEAEARERYVEHYHTVDHVLDAVEQGPLGVVRGCRELVALQPNSEFEAEFMRPYEMDDGVFVRFAAGHTFVNFLAVAPKRSESFDTAERVAVVGALARHLGQALSAGAYFAEMHNTEIQFDETIATIRHGVVIVDPSGRIVRTNPAAERILACGDGLAARTGVIEAVSATADAQLRRIFAGPRSGEPVVCRRASGKRPYVVHVVPMVQSEGAVLMIADPESNDEPPQEFLKRTFGLTGAEVELALRIMRGDGLNQIADELTVSKATVRTHLQHIFDKTGTHRQAELLRLLMTVSPSAHR